MQLSLHADFSCRTLIYLALLPQGAKASIEEIGRAYGISVNHLVKVVHGLGKLGFIETSRGRGGGIRLGRPASQIIIGDVIRKTEPGFALVECMNDATNRCPIAGTCGLKPWLGKALDSFFAVLDDVTLAQVVENRKSLSANLGISPVPSSLEV